MLVTDAPVVNGATQKSNLDNSRQKPEVSVVMPCLDEADTLESCLRKARRAFDEAGIAGEIIVADNGSRDGSPDIARRNGARVVAVREKGYGSALMGGIAAAEGEFVIMGDADDSYDFLEVPKFVEKLREGYDLVQGCRLPSGGGRVMPGAMKFLHRWWGNPMFSWMVRNWFGAPIHDVNCGLRGFRKTAYESLDQRCTGMEFAVEMVIKSSLYNLKIGEVPITLHKDGRIAHAAHQRTFYYGWRTLRVYLLYSPRWLFLLPGAFLILLGAISYLFGMFNVKIGSAQFDVQTILFGSLFVMCGYQSIIFAFLTKTFAINEKLMPEDRKMTRLFEIFNLERVLIVAVIGFLIGVGLLLAAVNEWRLVNWGVLDFSRTMRLVVPGATLVALGFQTILFGFFFSILGMKHK